MNGAHGDQIVDGYLARVAVALSDLPAAQRAQIMADVRGRIARARASIADETDADVFRLLERIGEPAAVAAQGRDTLPGSPRTGWLEVLAIAGLILVWPVGVVLLWLSRVWTRRAKLIGTLAPPGGYAALLIALAWLLLPGLTCQGPSEYNGELIPGNCPPGLSGRGIAAVLVALLLAALVIWFVLPIVSAVYLTIGAWRSIGPPLPSGAPAPSADHARSDERGRTAQASSRGTATRLSLILATVTAPAVLFASSAGAYTAILARSAQPAVERPAPVPSPTLIPVDVSRLPVLPHLTPSQLKGDLADKGFSCSGPTDLGGPRVTFCSQGRRRVFAWGTDDQAIRLVQATQMGEAAPATEFFDTVARAVCGPEDAALIDNWMQYHVFGGGDTEIESYIVSMRARGGMVSLDILTH